MAKFEVLDQEGMHFVQITLDNETVQAESGALCLMRGNITMDVKLPTLGRALTSYLAEEAQIRPTYTGTGTMLLESSFGGFHFFDLGGETWILDSGSYWASEGSVTLSAIRERAWTSFWAGEGLIDWHQGCRAWQSGAVVTRSRRGGCAGARQTVRGERQIRHRPHARRELRNRPADHVAAESLPRGGRLLPHL